MNLKKVSCISGKNVLVTGVDEAGRGALIGPMVICGITVEKTVIRKLKKIGVRDSKMLVPRRREYLYNKIKEVVQNESGVSSIIPISIPPCKIDSYRSSNVNLNTIEVRAMAEIINMCGGSEVYIDALTSRPERFKKSLVGYLDNKKIMIIAENNADKKYPIVSAASIIAKVERDRAIEELKQKVGVDFGVGYPSDERTIEFVESLIKSSKKLPPYVRKSWVTTQVLQEKKWQRKIKDFILRK